MTGAVVAGPVGGTAAGWAVGLLVALVVLVLTSRPGTRVGVLRAERLRGMGRSGGAGGGDGGPGGGGPRAGRAGVGRWARRGPRIPDRPGGGLDEVLVGVAAALRSGAAPADAWTRALAVPVRGPVPSVADLPAGGATPGAAVVVAAAQVADELGAPLAGVLDRVAQALAADDEAAAEVAAAVAGPRSSARVLGWLPLLAALLGAALGADPVAAVRAGGVSAEAVVAGVALTVAGRAWAAALVRRAERASR